MVDLEPTIIDNPNAMMLEGPIESVQFEDVHFTYRILKLQF